MSEDEALSRRAAREARRAAMGTRARDDGDGEAPTGAAAAAREAATAAAVGAAVGAVKAFAARQQRDEEPEPEEDLQPEPEVEPEPEAVQDEQRDETERPTERRAAAPPPEPREGAEPSEVERAVRAARDQLLQLHGADAESISAFGRTRDGWRVTLEVVELRRIPETTDVLASYLVELDDARNLVAFERLRRYQRSEAARESS